MPVKLQDVASIFDSTVNDEQAGWFDDERSVVLSVVKNPDANIVKTVDDIMKRFRSSNAGRRRRSRCM